MSMQAVFIQVDADEAARIHADPSLAEALFENPAEMAAGLAAFGKLNAVMQERMRTTGPQMMAKQLSQMDPRLREMLEQRLGTTAEALASGHGGEQLLKAMEARQARAQAMMDTAKNRSQYKRLSLDKEWHGAHYLLCGKVEDDSSTLGQAVMGGLELGEGEGFSGYGPARLLTPDKVEAISEALNAPALETEAAGRFDASRMNKLGIYPGFRASDLDGLLEAICRLSAFYADAASSRQAIVTCIV